MSQCMTWLVSFKTRLLVIRHIFFLIVNVLLFLRRSVWLQNYINTFCSCCKSCYTFFFTSRITYNYNRYYYYYLQFTIIITSCYYYSWNRLTTTIIVIIIIKLPQQRGRCHNYYCSIHVLWRRGNSVKENLFSVTFWCNAGTAQCRVSPNYWGKMFYWDKQNSVGNNATPVREHI